MASSAQMATLEDDRKQRFRFHKDDEILLLQIVLRAKPCPYKISSRDGAIMVAWNSIAEEFKVLCKPRHDGIVPHSRTCRTRTDKLIADFLANRATAHLRPQKQETKEDKIKNSLVTKLAAIQGKIEAPPPDPSDPANNAGDSPIMTGSVSGTTQLNTPAHLLTQGSSSLPPPSMSDLQLHGHSHSQQQQQQQHRVSAGLSTTTLMPQSLANIGSSNGHRMNHGQSTSELLAASSLLLATTNVSGGGLHSSHHQNSSPPNIFTNAGADQRPRDEGSQQQPSAAGRKRRGNRNGTSAAASVSTNQTPTTDYLQRPASVHSDHHATTPASKRLRSGAVTSQSHNSASTNTFDQQNGSKNSSNSNSNNNNNNNNNQNNSNNSNNGSNNSNNNSSTSNNNSNSNNNNSNTTHIPNHTRSFLGGIGTNLGTGLSGQDMAVISAVSNVGGNDDGHDEDDDDNEDDEGEDNESDTGGNGNGGYQHDRDDDFGNDYDGGYGQQDDADYANQTDASALLSLQNGSFSNNDNSKNNNSRNNKSSKRVAKRTADRGKMARSKYIREAPSSNWPVPMHPANSSSSNGNEAGNSTAGPNYFVPSQLNAEDRAYLMRTLALEEQRVKVEVEKIALERERLALERSRLQWEMRQMN